MNILEVHVNVENRQREMTRNRELFTEKKIDSNGIIILALEKQIPKKPKDDSVVDEEFWSQTPFERKIKVCPNCNNIYLRDKQKYCDNCGQAISWEVEE